MLISALAFLAGTCLLLLLPWLPDPVWLVALVSATAPMFRFRLLRCGAWIVLGFCWAAWQAGTLLNKALPLELQGRDIRVQGVVESLPEQLAGGQTRFYFAVTAYQLSQGWQPLRLRTRLHWYRGALPMQAGEAWQLRVRLKAPHGFANPGGFDYEAWLLMQGYAAKGYVRETSLNVHLGNSGERLDGLRFALRARLEPVLEGASHKGILLALVIFITLLPRQHLVVSNKML